MKALLLACALFLWKSPDLAAAEANSCSCKCVTKNEEDSGGAYTTEYGNGKDREAAGEDLKKKLGARKCELSPVCSGSC